MKPMERPAHPPTSLAVDGIAHVGLKVSSLARSSRFYREILGLGGEPHGPGVMYVPSGKDRLVLYEGNDMTDIHFGFHVDTPSKVDGWKDWLKEHAVEIYEDITEDGKYRSIKLRDPDGHWIEISSP